MKIRRIESRSVIGPNNILFAAVNQREYSGIEIKGETGERAKMYVYLGITSGAEVKKVHSRSYCLKKFRSPDVHEDILHMF